MATGYTSNIKDGISFKEFAMNCARNFGACISLREEGGAGDRIPEKFEPSQYHAEKAQEAREWLARLAAMTPQAIADAAQREWVSAEEMRLNRLAEIAKQKSAYGAMLANVIAWNPPTPEHENMKKFMRQQIEDSIKFDCGGNYYDTPEVKLPGAEWEEKRRAELERDLHYHEREHAAEARRAEERTEWVRALRASL